MYSVEKTKGLNFSRQFDYPLFIGVLLLSVIGLFVLSSATKVMPGNVSGHHIMLVQGAGFLIGIVAALVLCFFDYKNFKSLGLILYIFSIILLVAVLFFGVKKQDSRSWFNLPGMGSFQPAEIGKITMILFVCIFVERIKEETKNKKANIIKFVIYSMIPIVLVLKQPDMGTAMVFMFILFVIVFVGGLPYKYIGGMILAAIPVFLGVWFFVLDKYQKLRFLAFLYPDKYQQDAAFNVQRAMIAIGSGQLDGKGLYRGIQTQNMGVPVKESDFIFSVIGEELGFIGCVVVIALIVFILLRCIYIAKNSRDLYGSYLVIGITGMMAFHFIENIGMNIGVLPVTGIPLPFVSQGGSSMVTNYIAIGIVLSVSMRRKRAIFNAME
ncbi:MAG: rod shape-determining protein RodA [Bacillota bacterium]|nr:rod shape-determining protein RodA [Bacillota bacterium]